MQIQGTEAKVTKGIVSSLSGFRLGKEKVDYVFQVDATINHGNSGGPVVNEWGALIGVSAAGLTEFGIDNAYYAVKLDEVIKFLPKDVKLEPSVLRKRRSTVDVVADVIKSTVIINARWMSCLEMLRFRSRRLQTNCKNIVFMSSAAGRMC